MPRPKTFRRDDIAAAAMRAFWTRGYNALSIDDLVAETGASRHALYSEVGGKHALYLAAFEAYRDRVVTPAFAQVEEVGGLRSIEAYFRFQIRAAEQAGLPGPGCLVGNAATETAPHDAAVKALVDQHTARLEQGFANALAVEAPKLDAETRDRLAEFLTVSAQGLWASSRTVSDPAPLHAFVSTLMDLLERRLNA